MSNNHDKTVNNELDQATTREIHRLCTRVYDEVISHEEMARLDQLLHDNSAARKLYFRYVAFHNLLLTKVGMHQLGEMELLRRHVTTAEQDHGFPESLAAVSLKEGESGKRQSQRQLWLTYAIAATLLFAVAASIFWTDRKPNDQFFAATNINQAEQPAETVPHEVLVKPPQLSYVSPSTRWLKLNEAFLEKTTVPAGNVLTMVEGEIELTYSTGTKLLLLGPAEFVVDSAGGKLRRGGLVASVTEAGHGFTIETPNGKVVDLGTEFGVAVDDFGVSEVSVFQGKVEAFPLGSSAAGKKIELAQGHGLQWNQDNLTPLNADLRRFAASVLDRTMSLEQAGGKLSLVDQFREATLDSANWKSLGDVQTTPSGLRMSNDGTAGMQPYLISAEEFDPADGPITVTCDLRFAEVNSADPVSFSILTRSADHRGIALVPWKGTLATCLRCSLGSEVDFDSGRLQAGVKLESDRELTNISWSGFTAPAEGTPYRVIMRDDGVNVSFSVSLRDEPSTTKTITCHSLFRGGANHVALEGSSLGTIVIDRVEIAQDHPVRSFSSYSDFSGLVVDSHQRLELEQKLLDSLAPSGAVIILQDDFEEGLLNDDQWTFLGDVLVRDGALQLGLPNAEGHIDTWKERPYLLTRIPLDPKSGTLTILGKISFTNNFLSGYGASFAVMTRADNQWGHGPEWANFVLQRGVRANFWPAAWNFKRSLEIHEILAPNSISELAIQGLQVDPRVRSYLFRVIDDGQSVTLTIVDPNKPEVLTTIDSPAKSVVKKGFVGFESSWGSPVTLDDVRIYQDNKSQFDIATPPND